MSIKNPRHSLLLTALVAVGVSVGVAACGGSSKNSSTRAAASAGAVQSGASARAGQRSGRARAAGRASPRSVNASKRTASRCRSAHPVRLPAAASRGGGVGGAQQLPNGVTREKFEAAMKKCGVPQGRFGATGRFNGTRRAAALTKFASCMREHGINLPTPNTSGGGPVFNTKGLDTAAPQFRAALATCRSELTTLVPPGRADREHAAKSRPTDARWRLSARADRLGSVEVIQRRRFRVHANPTKAKSPASRGRAARGRGAVRRRERLRLVEEGDDGHELDERGDLRERGLRGRPDRRLRCHPSVERHGRLAERRNVELAGHHARQR